MAADALLDRYIEGTRGDVSGFAIFVWTITALLLAASVVVGNVVWPSPAARCWPRSPTP